MSYLLSSLALVLLYLIGTYVVTFFLQLYYRSYRFRKFANANGAVPPLVVPTSLPWSLDAIYRTVQADRLGKDLFDDLILARLNSMKTNTVEMTGPFWMKFTTTTEPKNVQAILATQFNDFEIGAVRRNQFRALIGDSIFNQHGSAWARSRALFRPQFSRDNINDLESTEKATRILIDVLPAGEDGWTDGIDLARYFYRFTLDTSTHFLFGNSVESQLDMAKSQKSMPPSSADVPKNEGDFAEAFAVSQDWLQKRIKMQGLYWLCDSPRYRKATSMVKRFVSDVILGALQARISRGNKTLEKDEAEKYNLLDSLTQSTQDPIVLRDQLLALLAAGRDATANLLSWTFCLIGRDPRVFSKLRDAIIHDFGTGPESDRPMNLAAFKSCRYLQYVMSETLRLFPPVPINNRTAVRDTILPVGGGEDGSRPIPIMKGQTVNFVTYGIHGRKDIWGEDADEFIPERWENRKYDWSYLPFSGGPRVCLGQQYAITEASYLTIRLLQQFDAIEWLGPQGKLRKGLGLTLFPKDGVQIRLRYAKS